MFGQRRLVRLAAVWGAGGAASLALASAGVLAASPSGRDEQTNYISRQWHRIGDDAELLSVQVVFR